MSYRLLNYRVGGGTTRTGLSVGDAVYDLAAAAEAAGKAKALDTSSTLALLNDWARAKPALDAIAAKASSVEPVKNAVLEAPVQYPGCLYMGGANYTDHLMEMNGVAPPPKSESKPFFFLKQTRGAVIGPSDTIHLPSYSKAVDWEAEIALVIGKPARHMTNENALDCVAGYTIVNDLSARDQSRRTDVPFIFDWIGQKSFDTSAPMGPWIVPADQLTDHSNIRIKTWVNDELKQNSGTDKIIWTFVEMIVYLTKHVTLYPGDVVATGTPAGVGHASKTYLKGGDTVKIWIEGIGEISNPVVQD